MARFARMVASVGAIAVAVAGAMAVGGTPVAASPVAGASSKREVTIRQVAIGMNHGLAVDRNGAVFGWGDNGNGQVGDGTLNARAVPVPAANGRMPLRVKMAQVAAGGEHSLALGANGWIYSWGRNLNGQLGQGSKAATFVTSARPIARGAIPSRVTITQIAAGGNVSAALGSNGRLYAWGENLFGQLGDGTQTDRKAPVAVKLPSGVRVTDVEVAMNGNIVVSTRDNAVYAWGWNGYGQVGDGTKGNNRLTPVRVQRGAIPVGVNPAAVAAGSWRGAMLGSDGVAYAWGRQGFGEFGNGTGIGESLAPTAASAGSVPTGVRLVRLAALNNTAVAAGSDGKAYAWGLNEQGQVGDGSTAQRNTPVAVAPGAIPSGARVLSVAGNYDTVGAVASNGRAYAWGDNRFGQVGDGTRNNDRLAPTQIRIRAALLTKTPTPKIAGTAKVGRTISARAGTWNPGVTKEYRWLRSGKAISGATKSTYTLRSVDAGKRITVRVTGSKRGYVTVSTTSASVTVRR